MFCRSCGSSLPDGVRFCPSCGTPVKGPRFDSNGGGCDSQPSPVAPSPASYARPINSSRSLLVLVLLSLVTCGIYGCYFIYKLAQDINVMCEDDSERTPGLVAFVLLSFVTCGIYSYWWYYKIGNRLQRNASRYGLFFQENGTTVLLWLVFGWLLCGIGSLVGVSIIIKNTNAMAAAYNARHAFR